MKNWKNLNILIPLAIAAAVLAVSFETQAQGRDQMRLCKFRDGTEIVVAGKCPGNSHFVRYVW